MPRPPILTDQDVALAPEGRLPICLVDRRNGLVVARFQSYTLANVTRLALVRLDDQNEARYCLVTRDSEQGRT